MFLSGLFLYLAMRGTDIASVWQELRSASPVPLVLAMCVVAVSFWVRALRWGVLLGERQPVKVQFLFTSMMIGYLANNVLPARLGELVRIYVFHRKAGISKSKVAATVVLERLMDVLVLLALIGVLSFFLPLPPVIRSGSRMAAVICVALGMLLFFLALRGRGPARVAAQTVGWLSDSMGQKVQGTLERFVDGLSALRSGKQGLVALMLILGIWGMETISVGLIMRSLHLHLPWIASLFVLVVVSLSFAIPAGPGSVGTYEFFAVTALTPFAVDGSKALGLALVLHTVGYAMTSAVGLACLWTESLSLQEVVMRAQSEQEEKA